MYLFSVALQIILESLPISSSGHARLLGVLMPDYIDKLAHGPTVVIICVYFYKDLCNLLFNFKRFGQEVAVWSLSIVMATSVTVGLYLFMQSMSNHFPLWIGFLVTASLLFSTRWLPDHHAIAPSFTKIVVLGALQGVAGLPGISRLAITYVGACWLGYSPSIAFRISCALQVPLFMAGFLLGCVGAWHHGGVSMSLGGLLVICGAMVVAYFLLWFVERLMLEGRLWYLGWYMLLPTCCALIS